MRDPDSLQGLRESEARYRLMTEHVEVGIIVVRDGRFEYLNPAAESITGFAAAELLGRDFAPLIFPEDLPLVADRHQRRLRGESVEPRYDFRVVRKDGNVAWVQLAAVLVPWGEGQATLSFVNDINERKSAEEALRRSEARYRTVIDAAPNAVGIVIVRGNRVLLANPALQNMLGMDADMICGAPSFLDVVHPDDRALMARVARSAVESPTGSEELNTFRILGAGGRVVWVEGNSVQIEWEGRPATLAYLRDISRRRELEAKVQEALDERETMLENSVVGIAFLNAEGRLVWANRPMALIFGTDVKEGIGTSLEPYYPSRDEYLRIGGAVSKAVRAGRTFTEEVQMRRADGMPFWVYLSGKAVNPKDLSRGTVWVVMDITRRKELEAELQRKTSEQEAILQSTQIGITYSVDRVHQWCNETFAQMIGYPSAAAVIGQPSLIHFPDRAAWHALGENAYPLLAAGGAYSGEQQLKRADGTLFWVQLYGKAVDPAQPGRGSIWTFVDITQRHQAEEDTRRALAQQVELGQLKSRFVSMTSHEFRTPLATILSSTDLLRHYGERLPAGERAELFDSIASGVRRMTEMLDNVLVIGRADAGMIEFVPRPLAAGKVVSALAAEAAAAAGGGARLVIDDRSAGATAMLDERLLRHVVGNLVGNAVKYSPAGGSVELSLAVSGGNLVITVRDRGIGIPASDQPRLFETFHRAGNAGNIPGTGLGLAIVRRSIDLHRGTITVESPVGGESGTRFAVRLPVEYD